MKFDVEAAGGVIVRRTKKGRVKVLVVHRPNHRDWSFPKGKLDPGETHRQAAVREVKEETGLKCKVLTKVPTTTYCLPSGRSKRVKYWAMTPTKGKFHPNKEVDRVKWLTPVQAKKKLSYKRDRQLLDSVLVELDGCRF